MEQYLNLPFTAFQTTLATYAGQNIGAGKMDRVKLGVRQSMLMILAMTGCVSALMWIFTENITELFKLSGQAAIYCHSHLRTIALINIVPAIYMPLFGVFQGAKHGRAGTLVEKELFHSGKVVPMAQACRNGRFI